MWGSRLLLLLLSVAIVRSDFFHHYHMKKFLTYVAFARAMVRRPTILPIPIPIPIPISQNEVIKLPGSSAKSYLTVANGLGGLGSSFSTGGKSDIFTGSSDFGYSIPGSFDGGSSLGGSNIVVLDSNSLQNVAGAEDFASSSNVVRLVSRKPQFLKLPKPIFLSGFKKIMRNSESPYGEPMMHFRDKTANNQNPTIKKPIPVGERFRLP